MIQDRTSVFPKAFTELTFGFSNVLKVAPFTFLYEILALEWQDMEPVIFLASLVVKKYSLFNPLEEKNR